MISLVQDDVKLKLSDQSNRSAAMADRGSHLTKKVVRYDSKVSVRLAVTDHNDTKLMFGLCSNLLQTSFLKDENVCKLFYIDWHTENVLQVRPEPLKKSSEMVV